MIGIFDSGIGGLSVLRELQRQIPQGDFLYFGDTAGGPYDNKSPDFVTAQVANGLSYLTDSGADLLVVADHSAAACLTPGIRDRFSIPLFDILNDGVVPGVNALNPKALGILGPTVVETVGAHMAALQMALPETRMYSVAAPLLSPLIEAGWMKKPETVMIVKKYLHFFKLRQIDTLALGSNHYSILVSLIRRKMGKRVRLVDAAPVLAGEVKARVLSRPKGERGAAGTGTCRVVVSDLTDGTAEAARMFYGKNIRPERLA
jgi:glutamate racemase